jgi:hypothetical protein
MQHRAELRCQRHRFGQGTRTQYAAAQQIHFLLEHGRMAVAACHFFLQGAYGFPIEGGEIQRG